MIVYSVYHAVVHVFGLSRRYPCIRSITPLSVYSIYHAVAHVLQSAHTPFYMQELENVEQTWRLQETVPQAALQYHRVESYV